MNDAEILLTQLKTSCCPLAYPDLAREVVLFEAQLLRRTDRQRQAFDLLADAVKHVPTTAVAERVAFLLELADLCLVRLLG
jgi:hypothetical protein